MKGLGVVAVASACLLACGSDDAAGTHASSGGAEAGATAGAGGSASGGMGGGGAGVGASAGTSSGGASSGGASSGGASSGGTSSGGTSSGGASGSGGSAGGTPSYGSDGNGSPLGTSGCTVQTTNPVSALAAAKAGDVICVMGGSYGVVTISKAVTLRAALPTTLGGAVLTGSGATLDGFKVVGAGADSAAIRVSGDKHVISHNRVDTDTVTYGILLKTASNTRVESNTVTRVLNWGVDMRGDGNSLVGNNIFNLRRKSAASGDVDGVKFHGSDLVLRGNYIHDINQYVSAYTTDPPHVDCFQTHASSSIITKRVLIENNYCVRVSRHCLIAEHPDVGDIVFRSNVCEIHDFQNVNVKRSLTGGVWIYNNYVAGAQDKAIYTNSDSANSNNPSVYVLNNFFRGNPGDAMTDVSGPSTVKQNNLLVTAASPFANVPGFDSAGNTAYPELLSSDFAAAGARAFVQGHSVVDKSVSIPALPAWLSALEQQPLTDVDGQPRQKGSAVDLGAFEIQ